MLVASQDQVLHENILKNKFTRCEAKISEVVFSLATRYDKVVDKIDNIAERAGVARITVRRYLKSYEGILFTRKRRYKDKREITCELVLMPYWQHIDNLRRLVKKICPSLLRLPHFFKQYTNTLISRVRELIKIPWKLQIEMSYRNNPPIYINNLVTCKSPIKSERKSMVMRADKPDYVKSWQKKEESPTVDRRKLFPEWKAPVRPVEDLQESEKKNFQRINDPNDDAASNITSFLKTLNPELAASLKAAMFPLRYGKKQSHEENQKI